MPRDDDAFSRASEAPSRYSQIPKSEMSRLSNKTYVMHLEDKLMEEKRAREKLEDELQMLKKISSEISSQMGLVHK